MRMWTRGPWGSGVPVFPVLPGLLLVLALLASGGWEGVEGQGTATAGLDRVQTLLDDGRVDGARREYEQWWDRWSGQASREEQQRSLWLRGLLSIDVAEGEMDFRRLATEYPGGPYTDGALLRLGYAAEARGASAEARGHFERLVRDHPRSPLVKEASDRLGSPARGAITGAAAPAPAANPPAANPGVTPPSPPPAAAASTGTGGAWAVQLGAFSAMAGARGVADRARSSGYAPRLVVTPGSPLIRVRVGGFPDEAGARTLLLEVRARGLEATVVSDANRESPAG
jgi:hypothetical protein